MAGAMQVADTALLLLVIGWWTTWRNTAAALTCFGPRRTSGRAMRGFDKVSPGGSDSVLASASEDGRVDKPPVGFRNGRIRYVKSRSRAHFTAQRGKHRHTTDEHVVEKDGIAGR